VDNLCINQENIEEKNHQVAMMDEIYAHAGTFCIWLGEASKSSRIAMDFIEQEVLQQDLDSLCEGEDSANKWTALYELMQRPWFSRRWQYVFAMDLRKNIVLTIF
jgi:hypothetical protein